MFCLRVCLYTTGMKWGQSRVLDPLGLELQRGGVTIWVLVVKRRSSTRETSTPNHRALSLSHSQAGFYMSSGG